MNSNGWRMGPKKIRAVHGADNERRNLLVMSIQQTYS